MKSDSLVESFLPKPRVRKHVAARGAHGPCDTDIPDDSHVMSFVPKRKASTTADAGCEQVPSTAATKKAKKESGGSVVSKQTVRGKAKSQPKDRNLGKGEIDFPPHADLKVVGDLSPWKWAEKYLSCLQKAHKTRRPNQSVQLFTEFTGSACAEVCTESVGATLGCDVHCVSAGDIDAQCRRVIIDSSQFLKFDSCAKKQAYHMGPMGFS